MAHVQTVLGPVAPAALGVTLTHEHLHMDATPLLAVHGYTPAATGPFDATAAAEARWDPGSHPDNYRFTQDDLVAAELREFAALGGGCVVDLTPEALGRSPEALAAISRASGVHVVMGAGHYLARTHAAWVRGATVEAIADALVAEAREGVAGTGIRAGILGEIGTGDPVDAEEERVLEAVAGAAGITGLAISVHLHPWGRTGERVAGRLLAAGARPDRIVLGHATTAWDDAPSLDRLLATGVSLGFDLFGFDHSLLGVGRWPPADRDVVATVARLVRAGHPERLLLSGDVGVRTRLRAHGGWGYTHVQRHIVPLLHDAGVSAAELETLLVANPRRLLTIDGG